MKTTTLFIFLCLLLTPAVYGQNQTDDLPESLKARLNRTDAEFPGGAEKMMKFIHKQRRYANKEDEHFKVGIVYVGFIIEKDGTLDSIKLLHPLSDYYNNEALRIVKAMPKWKPATQGGQPVRTQFSFPINF